MDNPLLSVNFYHKNIFYLFEINSTEYSGLHVQSVRLKGNRQSTDCPVEWYQANQ